MYYSLSNLSGENAHEAQESIFLIMEGAGNKFYSCERLNEGKTEDGKP